MTPFAAWMLAQEARALLTRLERVKPFALLEPMVPAANLLPRAQIAIERHLAVGRRDLERAVQAFIAWLRGAGRRASAAQAQRRFTLPAPAVQRGADAVRSVQRRHHAAQRARVRRLALRARRGRGRRAGAARRLLRARRRSSAISIAAPAPRSAARARACRAAATTRWRSSACRASAWSAAASPRRWSTRSATRRRRCSTSCPRCGRCCAACRRPTAATAAPGSSGSAGSRRSSPTSGPWRGVGIASTLGLMAVVSLPRAFVFRVDLDDPHPAPWIRVMLSCAIGQALYPHPQWARFAALWASFYPLKGIAADRALLFDRLARHHAGLRGAADRNTGRASLRGRTLAEALATDERQPRRLAQLYRDWSAAPQAMYRASPSLVFAVIGQARAGGRASPEDESRLLAKLLTHWALASTLQEASLCARSSGQRRRTSIDSPPRRLRWLASILFRTTTRPGSITVTVADVGGAGGVLSGALVSLYRAPAGTTASKFNARTWDAGRDDPCFRPAAPTSTGRSRSPELEPALYVVKYRALPGDATRNAWRSDPAAPSRCACSWSWRWIRQDHVQERRLPGHPLSAAEGRRSCLHHGVLQPVRRAEAVREPAAAARSDAGCATTSSASRCRCATPGRRS